MFKVRLLVRSNSLRMILSNALILAMFQPLMADEESEFLVPQPEPAPLEMFQREMEATAPNMPVEYDGSVVGGTWIAQGPGPIINGQVTNIDPDNEVVGMIHTIAADPSNPDVLYAGAGNGGIWRTTNATALRPSWTPLTDDLMSLSTGALEFDPTDPSNQTLIAGIGRFSSFALAGGALTGLLLTHNGGDNWTEITDPLLVGENISGVAARDDLLLASSNSFFSPGGLFRSIDGGNRWSLVSGSNGLPTGGIFDLVGDPSDPDRFYASVRNTGIFRSDDGGASWTNISIADDTLKKVITMTINNNIEMAVASYGRLYVGVAVVGQGLRYIGFTDDHGAIWTAMDLPRTGFGVGDLFFSIVADPDIVYLGDTFEWVRGDTTVAPTGTDPSPQWESLVGFSSGENGTANDSTPHVDSREMVFDANGDIIEVSDGGIYRRTNPQDNSGDWFSVIGNIQTTEFHDIAYDTVSNIIIGGTQDNGSARQIIPGGPIWDIVQFGDGGDVAVDIISMPGFSIRYESSQLLIGFRRSTYDANNHIIDAVHPSLNVQGGGEPLRGRFVTPVELNAIDPLRLIIGGDNGPYESFDQGDNIFQLATFIVNGDGVDAVAYGGRRDGVDNPDVLYVGSQNQVFARTAAGAPLIETNYSGGLARDIVLDPDDWMTAYVVDSDQVFVTNDGGVTWRDITGNLSDVDLHANAFASGTTDSLFVGGRNGVFRMLTDSPGLWTRFGIGLPNAPVFDLDYDPEDGVLVAGTFGRGAWLISNDKVPAEIVNDLVSFEPDPSTFSTTANTTGCPARYVGKFNFESTLTNISSDTLSALQVEVKKLTHRNLLLTDEGLIGKGEKFVVPMVGFNADGQLSPEEFVDVPLTVCLRKNRSFRLFVDVLGVLREPERRSKKTRKRDKPIDLGRFNPRRHRGGH